LPPDCGDDKTWIYVNHVEELLMQSISMMGTLLMNSVAKFCWSLLIALYLLSPNSNLVTANQDFQDNGPSGKGCYSAAANSHNLDQSLSNYADDDSTPEESDSSYPCHMQMAPFSCPYFPLTANFDTIEKAIPLPEVYSSIFVPPQEIS